MIKATTDLGSGLNEVDAVVVVLLEARADGEDVEVEDNVHGVEAHSGADHNVERALADPDLILARRGLPFLVKGHDNACGAIALHELGLSHELLLAHLERDRIEEAFALEALELSKET